jgi:hypothetical protein
VVLTPGTGRIRSAIRGDGVPPMTSSVSTVIVAGASSSSSHRFDGGFQAGIRLEAARSGRHRPALRHRRAHTSQ